MMKDEIAMDKPAGWTCSKCGGPVAGPYAKCRACGTLHTRDAVGSPIAPPVPGRVAELRGKMLAAIDDAAENIVAIVPMSAVGRDRRQTVIRQLVALRRYVEEMQ